VSSDVRDPLLYNGLAYFVPLLMYKEWLEQNKTVHQEVSVSKAQLSHGHNDYSFVPSPVTVFFMMR
jgi:hypothetical protein